MTDAAKLRMTPKRISGFAEWSIFVEWPDGREQFIDGFDSPEQIRAWIAKDAATVQRSTPERSRAVSRYPSPNPAMPVRTMWPVQLFRRSSWVTSVVSDPRLSR